MGLFKNRLRTIVGEDASFSQAIARLGYYIFFTNKFSKVAAKLTNKKQEHRFSLMPLPIKPNNINPHVEGTPLISIIIPTRNKYKLVKQCIDSIITKSTYRNYEIILVDNRSDEADLLSYIDDLSKNESIRFKSIKADIDFNFSSLINLGASHSNGAYLLLLNNDVEVMSENWLEDMLIYAQHTDIGAVGAKLLYPDFTIQHAGIVFSAENLSQHIFLGEPDLKLKAEHRVNHVQNYLAVTAACLMVSKTKFEEANGFDEQFKVEFNDIDFCFKLHQKGYHNVYLPQVKLFHFESASRQHPHAKKASYQQHLKEVELVKQKWSTYINADPFF